MTKPNLPLHAVAVAVGLVIGGVAVDKASAQIDSKSIPEIKWNTTLNKFQFDSEKFVGQRFTAKCPPVSVRQKLTGVYGTDTYPSNNSICIAAVHAGKVGKDGGLVTVQLNPGQSGYTGSSRNGVKTATLPGTPRSFVFVDGANSKMADKVHLAHVPRISWDTKFTATGFAHRKLVGQRFTFNCPAAPGNMRSRRVVGTDSYAFHTMVCRAAVHAGKISLSGGVVSVQMDPGKPKLVGSIRNGIESKDGPGGHRTISFVDSTVQK